jgi:ABC-type Na+ efflux pump permease subunit
MADTKTGRPLAVTVLAISLFLFGLLAFGGSLLLWGEGFLLRFPRGVEIAFPVTDLLVNVPASLLAAVGLWRMRRYGYVASYFVAGFYLYAQVYITIDVISGGLPGAPEILGPVVLAVLVALALLIYPERYRARFH